MKYILLVLVLIASSVSLSNEGTGEKIGKKVDKAVDDVSEFSKEQREKIQKEFKVQLSNMDQEISELKIKAKEVKETASEESKKQINEQLAFLEKRRKELKVEFKSLQNSSGKAWDEIKTGFQNSIMTLKESFKKAKQEFQSEDKK